MVYILIFLSFLSMIIFCMSMLSVLSFFRFFFVVRFWRRHWMVSFCMICMMMFWRRPSVMRFWRRRLSMMSFCRRRCSLMSFWRRYVMMICSNSMTEVSWDGRRLSAMSFMMMVRTIIKFFMLRSRWLSGRDIRFSEGWSWFWYRSRSCYSGCNGVLTWSSWRFRKISRFNVLFMVFLLPTQTPVEYNGEDSGDDDATNYDWKKNVPT